MVKIPFFCFGTLNVYDDGKTSFDTIRGGGSKVNNICISQVMISDILVYFILEMCEIQLLASCVPIGMLNYRLCIMNFGQLETLDLDWRVSYVILHHLGRKKISTFIIDNTFKMCQGMLASLEGILMVGQDSHVSFPS